MAPRPRCQCGTCTRCKHRLYMRTWYPRNADKVRAWARRYREENLEQVRAYDRERGFHEKDPVKIKARKALMDAVRAGRLKRGPCEVCGAPSGKGHHDDYSRPFDVRWLCRSHHMEIHRRVAP